MVEPNNRNRNIPPDRFDDAVSVIIANNPSRPDFTMSLRINRPPVPQGSYRPSVGPNGVPFLYDPSARAKRILKQMIRHAIMRDVAFLQSDFPIFRPYPGETLKLELDLRFYVSRDADVDNMCKFLLDVLQGEIYENDKCVWYLKASKDIVARSEAKTQIYVTYCSL